MQMQFESSDLGKNLFKFNEVTSVTGVKPYVLRFWESEFAQIRPKFNQNGQKFYTAQDISAIEKIKKLLFDDKLSIPQAKGYLDRELMYDEEEVEEVPLVDIKSRSEDLKKALADIIEKNSVPSELSQSVSETTQAVHTKVVEAPLYAMEKKAASVANSLKAEIKRQNGLSDKDIVNLVSAKKKLTVIQNKIADICERRGWLSS